MPDLSDHKSLQGPSFMGFPFVKAPVAPKRKSERGRASWLVALRCRLRRNAIERELAAGVDPDSSECRHRRASQLTAHSSRETLAADYERMLVAATSVFPFDAVPSNWRGIRAARPRLDRLVERLREDRSVSAAGVARARLLLTDRHSALHVEDDGSRLVDEVRSTLARL